MKTITKAMNGSGRLLTAGGILAVAIAWGLGLVANSEASGLEVASLQEVEDLYGAACPGWDGGSYGCGVGGCEQQGELLYSSSYWHDYECDSASSQCDDGSGSQSGSCGSYQYIVTCSS